MPDPDRAIEHLLREAAATPSGEPSGLCLDVDTLAAWVDGRLSRAELTLAEVHAAGCARCQSMLAVMARTAEAGQEAAGAAISPRRSLWRMLPWMGPVAAAATAAAIYVAVRPGVDVVSQSAQEGAARQSAAVSEQELRKPQAALEPATPVPPAAPPARSERAAEKDEADRERQTSSNALRDLRSADSASKPAAKTVTRADRAAAAEELQKPSAFGGLSTAPQIPPAASERPAPASPPPPPLTVVEEAKRKESFNANAAGAAPAGARADALMERVAAPVLIQSPDLDIQWRVVSGNVVQRTTDRGRTWITQATGTTKAIAAGFSPSATVCWVVGAGGLVAMTTDGKTWTPVAFPHAIDLTNVQASSADAAVVFAVDGRTFTTADRGKTGNKGRTGKRQTQKGKG